MATKKTETDAATAASTPAASTPADITPATALSDPSGAILEKDAAGAVDLAHPGIDNNPRAGTTEAQNRIDMNDPLHRNPNDKDFAGLALDPAPYGKAK